MKITTRPFGATSQGQEVECIRLEHDSGITAEVLSYGAILRALWVPASQGPVQVCKGYDTLEEYQAGSCYLGALVGRYAGRIAGGRFTLNGKEYQVSQNQGENSLHGGYEGFDRKVWQVKLLEDGVALSYTSPDGEEGYPGTLEVTAAYRFTRQGTLTLTMEALAREDTVVSLTHHGYWNLGGTDRDSAADHLFSTPADRFVEEHRQWIRKRLLEQENKRRLRPSYTEEQKLAGRRLAARVFAEKCRRRFNGRIPSALEHGNEIRRTLRRRCAMAALHVSQDTFGRLLLVSALLHDKREKRCV